jgi:hypothetical protein
MAGNKSVPAAKWLTRRQVALLLGIAEEDVQRLDGTVLHPTQRSDRAWQYDPGELRRVLGRGAGSGNDNRAPDGDVTAAAFSLFEQGRTLPEVVIATKQTAQVVTELRRDYDHMVGVITLTSDTVDKLRRLLDVEAGRLGSLAEVIETRLGERYQLGYRDGFEEGEGCGEVIDQVTGERRAVRR